jgi:hypothetical protein
MSGYSHTDVIDLGCPAGYPSGMGLSDWQKQEYARGKESLVSKEELSVDIVKAMMDQRKNDRDWLDELAEMLKLQPQSKVGTWPTGHRRSAIFAENELDPPFIVTEVP